MADGPTRYPREFLCLPLIPGASDTLFTRCQVLLRCIREGYQSPWELPFFPQRHSEKQNVQNAWDPNVANVGVGIQDIIESAMVLQAICMFEIESLGEFGLPAPISKVNL